MPASSDRVFAFLADLENHWLLADRFIQVVSLERSTDSSGRLRAHGGRVRMTGPLGISRTWVTQVQGASRPTELRGTACLGTRSKAEVRWSLEQQPNGSLVTLCAAVDRLGMTDRLLLEVGGRAWLRRRFSEVMQRLISRFAESES